MGGVGEGLGEGYIVNERFQLLRLLGRGGMGSVWVARHLTLNIDVAIKFIEGARSRGRDDPPLALRPRSEDRAARIQSPHVVGILDYGFDSKARPFIAMELLQGESLSTRLEREEAPPAARGVPHPLAIGERAHARACPRHRSPRSEAGQPLPLPVMKRGSTRSSSTSASRATIRRWRARRTAPEPGSCSARRPT